MDQSGGKKDPAEFSTPQKRRSKKYTKSDIFSRTIYIYYHIFNLHSSYVWTGVNIAVNSTHTKKKYGKYLTRNQMFTESFIDIATVLLERRLEEGARTLDTEMEELTEATRPLNAGSEPVFIPTLPFSSHLSFSTCLFNSAAYVFYLLVQFCSLRHSKESNVEVESVLYPLASLRLCSTGSLCRILAAVWLN